MRELLMLPIILIDLASITLAQTTDLYPWNVTEIQAMDGTANNKQNPTWGSVGSPYLRITPSAYGPHQSPNGQNRPNARLVSNVLFAQRPWLHNTYGISDFTPAWGVMLHLDITVALRNDSDPFPIPLPPGEVAFNRIPGIDPEIPVSRSNYIGVDEERNVRIIPNAFTSFIDCSGLYGNSIADMNNMRSFVGGKLKSVHLATGEYPPFLPDGNFAYNILNLNMMPHLGLPYLMFFREHNRRAQELAEANSNWDDELLFQRSRRWVIAAVQRITANFYVPAVTGQSLDPYTGYNPNVNPQVDLFFANVAFRYGHSAINTLITRIDDWGNQVREGHLRFHEAFYANMVKEIVKHGPESMLRGFATQRDQEIDTHFTDEIRNLLPLNPMHHFDLAAIGIQRSRELGLPDYNTLRKFMNFTPALYWSDITSDIRIQETLATLYSDINDLDPYVGAFAEDKVEKHSIVGPMMRKSIREQFTRLRDGDRFWYESPGVLSDEELRNVSQLTLGEMVRRNTNLTYYPDDPFIAVALGSKFFLNGPKSTQSGGDISNEVTALGILRLIWKLRVSDGFIDFRFESNSTGWFGFGFGPSMIGADIYFCYDNGSGIYIVQDSWSTATLPIPSDTSQGGIDNVINGSDITHSQSFSKRVVTFTRALSTGDKFDVDILETDMNIIFAFSQDNTLVYHGPSNRMVGKINFYTEAALDNKLADMGPTISPGLKAIHGASMYISFGYIYPMGMFIARYSRNLGKWLSIHRSMMSLVTSNVLMAALTAIVGSYGDASFFHYKIGLVVVALIFTAAILGYMSISFHERIGKFGSWAERVRLLHRLCGGSGYLLGLVAGYFGVCDISAGTPSGKYLPWIYVGTVAITPVGLLIYGQYSVMIEKVAPIVKEGDFNALPVFMWDDVNARVVAGSKWVVIDNIIYDVEKYLPSHPGGQQLLLQMIGLDATRNFHGLSGDIQKKDSTNFLRPNVSNAKNSPQFAESSRDSDISFSRHVSFPRHEHTRFAKFILAGMAVGRLRVEEIDDHIAFLSTTKTPGSRTAWSTLSSKRPRSHSGEEQEDVRKHMISSEKFTLVKLERREILNESEDLSNVYLFRFIFKHKDVEVYAKPGNCFLFQFVALDGTVVTRSYWCFRSYNRGSIEFLIKNVGGQMTKYLMESESVRIRGPIPEVDVNNPYTENGTWKVLGIMTEGIGLTAALLIIDYHLRNCKRDPVTNRPMFQIHLLATFNNENEFFGQRELAKLESNCEGALVITTLLKVSLTRTYSGLTGNITNEVISATMPKPGGSSGTTRVMDSVNGGVVLISFFNLIP
ncbi:heme peroxidase [Chytriomyces sp. MP71]|nr:heme peroxidase [Chytriomyces sp. MP71]